MDAFPAPQKAALEVAAQASQVRPRGAAWLAILPLTLAVVSVAAMAVQQRFAPLFLWPMLLGAVVGFVVGKSAAACRVRKSAAIVLAAGLAGASLVPSMHVIGWLQFRESFHRQSAGDPRLALARSLTDTRQPPDLLTFLQGQARHGRHWIGGRQTGAVVWWSWGLDAALAAAAAAVAGFVGRRKRVP